MGQWDKSCSIISRVCGAKVHALFSITQLFVRLFVRDNVCSHAEAQRAQSSHRDYVSRRTVFVPLIMNFCPAEPTVGALGEAKWRKSRKFDSQSDWREDFFYNGRNGNYRKINGKGYVFRIK